MPNGRRSRSLLALAKPIPARVCTLDEDPTPPLGNVITEICGRWKPLPTASPTGARPSLKG